MEQSGQLVRPITSRSRGSNPVPAIMVFGNGIKVTNRVRRKVLERKLAREGISPSYFNSFLETHIHYDKKVPRSEKYIFSFPKLMKRHKDITNACVGRIREASRSKIYVEMENHKKDMYTRGGERGIDVEKMNVVLWNMLPMIMNKTGCTGHGYSIS